MASYSVQHKDRKFVKGYGFLSFAENMGKNVGKNKSKNLNGKYSQKLQLNNMQQIHLKLLQEEQLKTKQKQLVIWLVMKLQIELQQPQKPHN